LKRRFLDTRRQGETIDLQFMADCQRLHAPAGSICRHGTPGAADDSYHTIGAVLYIPARGQVQVMFGDRLCRARLEIFEFDF
jgi:hypothetical protein